MSRRAFWLAVTVVVFFYLGWLAYGCYRAAQAIEFATGQQP